MKIKLFTFFIGIFLLVSCYKEPGKIDVKAYQKSIKQQQFELGWINLPYTIKKNINEDKKKYKLISTKKVKNNTLLEILKPKTNSLYFDIDSISELSKDSKKIFRIKVLKTGNSNKFSGPLARQTILSHYEISCHSNKLKLINEIWWTGTWFYGIRHTWRDSKKTVLQANLEANFSKDDKWIKEFNSLLCGAINNHKNQLKKEALAKEKKRKEEAMRKEEKKIKARKVKEDNRKLKLDKAGKTCLDLGFRKGTKKYKNCVVELL